MEPVQKRRWRSRLERRRIVEETLRPGASVSRIARAHDINANQVFHWRKLYREGTLDESSTALLPVRISDKVGKPATRRESKITTSGVIDIELGHARVRIEGPADADCVRAALEGLLR
jgi:transposase